MNRIHYLASAVVLALATSTPARAQDSATLGPQAARPVFSMGQPSRWRPYLAGLALLGGGDGPSGTALAGVQHSITNPVSGVLGTSAEAYGTFGGVDHGAGVRLLATSGTFALGAGADWNVTVGQFDLLVRYQSAIRRGGLLGGGTMLRIDWLPTRHQTFGIGLSVPVLQPFAGRTRPRPTDVGLRGAPGAALRGFSPRVPLSVTADSALAVVAQAVPLITSYTSAYLPADVHRVDSAFSAPGARDGGGSYEAVMRSYDAALARAFGDAAGAPPSGSAIAARTRAGLLDDVIVPYDSSFGQTRETESIRALTALAQQHFARWVRDSAHVAPAAQAAVLTVNARWLSDVERVHRDLLGSWHDSRLVWLPLQLALAPEQFDEQAEVDSLIARVVGQQFSDQNALTYLSSIDLPLEIARQIYAARDYHVLWMHDFAGQRPSGAVDNIGYEMVANVYLPALTAAVARYDSTGRLPVYMILLDEYFYESTNGRLWMTILQDPLDASMALPGNEVAREDHLRQRQRELRAAVAASVRLQRDAARLGGASWLRRLVKVNVNITQPADFSFRSVHIVPPLPFTPDNIMRDHRKIAFYDLNEAQPYRGGMILMGVGIGEHYASATWEDRGYRIRGPATLEVRAALRRILRQNGFREDQIPLPLRAVKGAPADSTTERRMNTGEYVGRALQVHNDAGFGPKKSSVARALLYTLTPPGSVMIIPDPLWLSETWAAMLAGAAARGSRVFVIAPALANAPSPQAPLMAREHEVMLRLLQIAHQLGPDMRQAGGELRVGIFDAKAPANDVAGRVREVRAGLTRNPWIRQVIPFDDSTLAVLDRAATQTAADGQDATALAHDEKPRPPQLHQKTQLIARPGAISALVRQPGWDRVLAGTMRTQSRETARFAEQLGWQTPDVDTTATRSTDARLRGYEQSLSEAERKRVSFYFSLGTQNEDPRGIVSDGEASILVSGFNAAAGLVDLYFMMTRSDWVTTQAQLEQYVPRPSGLMRRLAAFVRVAL